VIVLYFQTELINTSPYSINMALFLTAVGILLASPFSASGSLILPPKAQARFANWHLVRGVLFYATALILGFTYAYHHCHALKSAILPAQYDNQTLLMEGFVCGLPRQSEFSNAAEFCITSL